MAGGVLSPLYGQSLDAHTFADATEQAGLTDQRESLSVAWIDYNGDGWVDLWLGVHGISPDAEPRLYLNQGDGTFEEAGNRIWANGPPHRDMHGSAWADFDNDGDPDLLQTAGGGGKGENGKDSNYFFVNEGGVLTDRAEQMGVALPYGRGRSALWLDYDGDERLDLLQSNDPRRTPPYTTSQLFGQTPEQRFEKANETASFHATGKTPLAQLGDVTGDGALDLVVYGFPFPQRIYRGGSFPLERVDTSLVQIDSHKRHWVADGAIADLDGDHRSDFYLTRRKNASDVVQVGDSLLAVRLHTFSAQQEPSRLSFKASGPIQLLSLFPWRPFAQPASMYVGKQGYEPEDNSLAWKRVSQNGENYLKGQSILLDPQNTANWGLDTSQQRGLLAGYDPKNATWTLKTKGNQVAPVVIRATNGDLRDISLDGQRSPRMDNLLWTYDTTEARYVDRTAEAGLNRASSCTSVGAGDFDNDMDVDLYLSCARLLHGQPNRLLENRGDGTFRAVPAAGGAEGATQVTGWNALGAPARVTVADYDRDGFLDLLIPPTATIMAAGEPVPAFPTTPTQLFRNTGNDNHWLEVDLKGTASNADALGARVDVTAGGVTQRRFQDGGKHRFAQDQQRLHFGLAQNTRVDSLTVRWPSGRNRTFTDVDADQVVNLVEGAKNLRSLSVESFTHSLRQMPNKAYFATVNFLVLLKEPACRRYIYTPAGRSSNSSIAL